MKENESLEGLRLACFVFGGIHFMGFALVGGYAILAVPMAGFIAAALMPERFYDNRPIRRAMISLFILSLLSNIWLMYKDLTLINGSDYPAFIIRLLASGVLFSFARRIYKRFA